MRLRWSLLALLAVACNQKSNGTTAHDMAITTPGGGGSGGGGGGGTGGGNMPGSDMSASVFGDMTGPAAAPDMSPQPYDWPQFGFDEQHSGNNTREATITKANVATLALKQQMSFASMVDGAPVYLSGVTTTNGTQDLVFIATTASDIYALDAKTLKQVWMKSHPPAGNACTSSNGNPCYTTSQPAIDPNRQFVYVYGLDGKVHKHGVADGAEVTSGGWPQLASLKPNLEKGSSSLAVAGTKSGHFLYVTSAGYPGDKGDYQGHLTIINLGSGSQKIFNTLCSNQAVHFTTKGAPDCTNVGNMVRESAVWARPGVFYRPDNDRIYFSTGNGPYDATKYFWGDSMLTLNADGTGTATGPLDSWTPVDQAELDAKDADLGSTGPVFLPVPAGSKYPHIAMQCNKEINNTSPVRIINLDDMSGQGGPGNTGGELFSMNLPQDGEVLTQPAVWVNPADQSTWVFVANDNGISALKVVPDGGNGKPSLMLMWMKAEGGSSPVIANNILFYAGNGAGRSGTNTVYAIDPTVAMGTVLWSAQIQPLTGAATIGGIHWESVMVAHGTVYIASENGNSSDGIADGTGYLSTFALP
jgi:hypothetical protein